MAKTSNFELRLSTYPMTHLRSALIALVLLSATHPAFAFETPGHDVLEAAAYRYLLNLKQVDGLDKRITMPVSGKDVLDYLIYRGVLAIPPCYESPCAGKDRSDPRPWLPIP